MRDAATDRGRDSPAAPPAGESSRSRRRRPLVVLVSSVFGIAMMMGFGPGLWLVNPGPDATPDERLLLGMPKLYTWGLCWFAVMAGSLLVAYRWLWTEESDAGESGATDVEPAPGGDT